MFSHNSDFIDTFRNMYQTSDKTPVLIANSQMDTFIEPNSIHEATADEWKMFPIPSRSGNVFIQSLSNKALTRIEVWDVAGRKVKELNYNSIRTTVTVALPEAAGIYYLKIEIGKSVVVRKVVRE